MNFSLRTLPSVSSSPDATRRLLLGWLPIVLVGGLIFWLSGGLPPTAWQLLIQMLSRWSVVEAALGSRIYLPLAIVIVQSILILVAWVVLVLTIWREVAVFKTIQVRQRIVNSQAELLVPQAPPNESLKSDDVPVQPEELFEEDTSPPLKNTGIQIVSSLDEQDDMFDASTAVFELVSEHDASENDSTQNTGSASLMHNKEETIFVYGNPFEGELPEVFQYDMDLKREVHDMQEDQKSKSDVEDGERDKVEKDEVESHQNADK